MADHYTLYGSYASYYTAKVRAYMRKKGVPFEERLPSATRFREHVRPSSGTHRIPQMETPAGDVVQDSVEMVDYLEARFSELPACPATPRQALAVRLMELFGSEGLVRLAWEFRWYPEGNDRFVRMDFGRSFKPQGTDDELLHYGGLIADRMLSHGAMDRSAETHARLEQQYGALLAALESHFQLHPYFLGGHPSFADYALMGALHAHMGRDPVPLHFMQTHAPRVFRWVEHMLVPEVQSPEFPDTPIAYPDDDGVPETAVAVLRHLITAYGQRFEDNHRAWVAYAAEHPDQGPGQPVSATDDQPVINVELAGSKLPCSIYHTWMMQRAQRLVQSLGEADRSACDGLLSAVGNPAWVTAHPGRWLTRENNRLCYAAPEERRENQ